MVQDMLLQPNERAAVGAEMDYEVTVSMAKVKTFKAIRPYVVGDESEQSHSHKV